MPATTEGAQAPQAAIEPAGAQTETETEGAPAPMAAAEPTEDQMAQQEGAPAPEGGAMDATKPAPAWAQCGGTASSDVAVKTWQGPTSCVENSTCVVISPQFSQCVPIVQARGYGCSSKYSQCGGSDPGVSTAWSGPYCCSDAVDAIECVYFNKDYSQCKPCNGVWEQCGGVVPGTSTPWTQSARAQCCAKGSMCKYVSSGFYQCQPM